MNIKTKEFNISEDEFRHITRGIYYKAIKFLLIMVAILAVTSILTSIFSPPLNSIAVLSIMFLGFLSFAPFIGNSAKAQSKLNFQNRICEITDNYFSMTYEDGSLSKIHFNNFVKITKESDWYFLYLTQVFFEYLPIRAFNSEDDINEFETLIKNKKLME